MGQLTIVRAVTGIADGITHTIGGTETRYVDGHYTNAVIATTTYAQVTAGDQTQGFQGVLVVNDGANEVWAQMDTPGGGDTLAAYPIPAGRFKVFFPRVLGMTLGTKSGQYNVSVRTNTGESRVIVHCWY